MPRASTTTIVRTTAQIADNAVEQADIADNAVGLAELASGTAGTMIAFDSAGDPVAVPAGTAGQLLQSNGADTPSWTNSGDYAATAGEALTAGDAAMVGDGSETANEEISQTTSNADDDTALNASGDRVSQWFTFPAAARFTKITGVSLYLVKDGAPTGNLTVELYAVDGSNRPTGAALASGTIAYASITGGATDYTITFGTPYTATRGTNYVIVLNPGAGVSTNNDVRPHAANTSQITGSIAYSTDSGSSWTDGLPGAAIDSGDDLRFKLLAAPTAGSMYKTDASNASWTHNFIGFVNSTVAAGASASAKVAGVVTGLSGLTPGAEYYLSDTAGAIASSAGSTSKKVGVALTATELLIKNATL